MAHVSSTVADLYVLAEGVPCTRVRIDPPAFSDGDEVIVIGGTMTGLTGKIIESDSRPGTASVYVPAWGCISHNVPEEHLHRLS